MSAEATPLKNNEGAAQALGAVTVVSATTAVQALVTMGMMTLPAIAPQAAQALGVAPVLIGVQISLLYGVAAVSSLFGARWVRRFGAARTSQMALGFIAAGLLFAATPSLTLIAFGSVLMGTAYGLPNPAAAHVLMRFTSTRRRNLVFSVKQTGVPLGGILAGLLAPPAAEAFSWQMPLIATAVVALLLAAALTMVRARWDDDRDPVYPFARIPIDTVRTVLSESILRHLLAVGLLLAAIQLCLMTFLVVLLVADYGFEPIAAGVTLALVQAAGVAGRILWGLAADRTRDGIGTLLVIAAAITVLAAGVPLSGAIAPALVLPLLIGLGATAIAWNGVFLAETARLAPIGHAGEATAVVLSGTYLGVFVGPAIFAALVPVLGSYSWGFLLLAAAAAASIGFLLRARRRPPV